MTPKGLKDPSPIQGFGGQGPEDPGEDHHLIMDHLHEDNLGMLLKEEDPVAEEEFKVKEE